MSKKTIAALATPPGKSGLAVIRVSGDLSYKILTTIFEKKTDFLSHKIYYGNIIDNDELIDKATAVFYKAPNSYTGENSFEIFCHGGIFVIEKILNLIYNLGADYPEPGEFSLRAYKNGKIDLTQAEAIENIINATSANGAKIAARQLSGGFKNRINELTNELIQLCSLLELDLDFNEEGLDIVNHRELYIICDKVQNICINLANDFNASKILRSGYFVAIAGKPNSGKSALFNALLKRNRAIVSDIEGTTRDYLEEKLIINDMTVNIFDTAGIRETDDEIEIEGVKMSKSVLKQADLILFLNDVSSGLDSSYSLFENIKNLYKENKSIYIQNKCDLVSECISEIKISAKYNIGIDELKKTIYNYAIEATKDVNNFLVNERHSELLKKASLNLEKAKTLIEEMSDNVIISYEIRNAIMNLEYITGERYSEDILNSVFEGFCIGK